MSAIITDPNYPLTDIDDPGVNDVMCGRGGGTNNHIGNRRFRMLVNEHKLRYLAATKLDKPKVAREVMIIWRKQDPPGRFLTKDSKSNRWSDVGDQKAREKASQCLRERRSPTDVLPFLMPGKKKKLQEQNSQSNLAAIAHDDGSVGSEGDSVTEQHHHQQEQALGGSPLQKKKMLPRMQQMESLRQLEQMQQMQQEMKIAEMQKMILQQQQQQQQQQQELINQLAQQQRMFPRQLARSQTLPMEMKMPGMNNMVPPAAPQSNPNTPAINNMNQMQLPGFQRQMTAPVSSGWDDSQNSNNLNGLGNNVGADKTGQFQGNTAASAAFRMDLTQKYGIGASGQLQAPLNDTVGGGNSGGGGRPGFADAATSAYSSMRSLEFEDLKEWADISQRSLGVSQRSFGVSSRDLGGEKKSDAGGGFDDDNMDWMKSFKSLSSSNKDVPLSRIPAGSPGNSLRNIMNAVDENNALQHIQPLGFDMDEQSQTSWRRQNTSRQNSMRRLKMERAKGKMHGASSTSMMSELTDLSADLVALDLAAMEN